ncbi:5-(carboxyamino)imidazole ribonucleotide synthase [Flavobacterium sp.]|uniref:5-(carboxyamino)imidazole ribonucleotide synthase n=1 Tax=Flavobacterium sp. TaxID=239 RepID=UPI003B99A0F3
MSFFSSDFTLGILGGGQLGKMLLTETRKFDIKTAVLDPDASAPGRIATNSFSVGNLMDFQTVVDFGRQADVITVEIEAVNTEALAALEAEGKKVYPPSAALKIIQNKCLQKAHYGANNIPTSPFTNYESLKDLMLDVVSGTLSLPFVWKSAEAGYDGFGVQVVREIKDLDTLKEGACLAENLVDFQNEIAVIVARNAKGEAVTYPVVEMEFHPTANQVEFVLCPARINDQIAQHARELALRVADSFKIVGLLAVELFLTKTGELLVNEVAPRPHNSGHYSIEASVCSQFENHLRAVLNLPLGDTSSKMAAVMVNLVGAAGFQGQVEYENIEDILKIPGVTPHIYGKRETRPFRKMGHVTIVHQDIEKARENAALVKSTISVKSIQ